MERAQPLDRLYVHGGGRRGEDAWATINLPWGHGVRDRMLDGIPTLVVTGGWNAEHERIAAILDARGAQHVVIDGAAHRPQDLPPFALPSRASSGPWAERGQLAAAALSPTRWPTTADTPS
ncbi:hypothetical protein [Microbacterium sp. EST19A]|uniref:hypothetical protein n=1 Tax=Microbacterium sp. EST19A TaxID=2862681 RepID=UPI001CBFFAA7|nr:hypothetical protein [Microbacterium sp. EST19A]